MKIFELKKVQRRTFLSTSEIRVKRRFWENAACEQAHLFERGAATESWREEWGEEKFSVPK